MIVDHESIKYCPACGKKLQLKDFGIEYDKACPEHGAIAEVEVAGEFSTIKIWQPKDWFNLKHKWIDDEEEKPPIVVNHNPA